MNIIYGDVFYHRLQRCKYWQETAGRSIACMLIRPNTGPKTLIDFGCGNGYYIHGAWEEGVSVCGLEYNYEACQKYVPHQIEDFVHKWDLTQPVKRGKFNYAMSLEVGEHLPEDKADVYVDSLTNTADNIIFSAAIPEQKGDNHINCQPFEYWIEKFNKRGYDLDTDGTAIMKAIYGELRPVTKYINVMKRNVMKFTRR